MLSRGCHLVVFVVVAFAPACRASSPCSPPPSPPRCYTWDPDNIVQVPVEVDLCVAGEASAMLAIQDHDSNDVSSLTVRAVASGVMLEARKGHEVKDTQTVPDAALRGHRLHLKIQYSGQDLRVLTWDDAALMDIPVDGADSVRVALTQYIQSHDAAICFGPTPRQDDATTTAGQDINGTQCCCGCHLGSWTNADNLMAAACVLLSVFVLTLTHYAVQPRPRLHAPAPARHTMEMIALRLRVDGGRALLPPPSAPPPPLLPRNIEGQWRS